MHNEMMRSKGKDVFYLQGYLNIVMAAIKKAPLRGPHLFTF